MSKSLAKQNAERKAFNSLFLPYHEQVKMVSVKDNSTGKFEMLPVPGANGMPTKEYVHNEFHVKGSNITCPSKIMQELPLNGASNVLNFIFSQNAPIQTPTLNNVTLAQNDIFMMYGLSVLFGVGALGVQRTYFTHGLLSSDNGLYQGSVMNIQFEQSQSIKNIDMMSFLYTEGTNFKQEETEMLINPMRKLTGKLGTFTVSINMQSLAGLVFTPNAYVRVSLLGVLGQAEGS